MCGRPATPATRAPPPPPNGYLYPGYVVNTEVDGVGVVCVSVICLKYNLVRVCVRMCVCECARVCEYVYVRYIGSIEHTKFSLVFRR